MTSFPSKQSVYIAIALFPLNSGGRLGGAIQHDAIDLAALVGDARGNRG